MGWNPATYLRFGGERTRPALDLVGRIPDVAARRVADLGCGTGNSTAVVLERWPGAHAVGVDSSPEMLAEAARSSVRAEWTRSTIEEWTPAEPVDVVFSNAAFHWVKDHPALLRRLLEEAVAPGGALAVQIPYRTPDQPFADALRRLSQSAAWSAHFPELPWGAPGLRPTEYFQVLSAAGAVDVDVWTTEYVHALRGEDPVLQWTRGTALLPFLARLNDADGAAFTEQYRELLRAAYPARPDGVTLFPFARLFFVARRPA